MKKTANHRLFGFLIFGSLLLLLATGCQKEPLSEEKQTVQGQGLTYTFQLPADWQPIQNYEDTYGRLAVFGAEDTRSKSGMSVILFPKDRATEEGFGEKTRTELAQKNGYANEEDVYMKEYEVNGSPAYKFTFETTFQGKKMWAHYYSIFSDHGIIQLLFYSSQDSQYEERIKDIDASVLTVKETDFDQSQAEEQAGGQAAEDQIQLTVGEAEIQITGLGTTSGAEGHTLLVLKYQVSNQGAQTVVANQWSSQISIEQGGKALPPATLPADSPSYELTALETKGQAEVAPGETGEGILLYTLENTETAGTLRLGAEATSDQHEYPLVIPINKETNEEK